MAWYPQAVRREITKHRTPIAGPRRLVLHTAVSSAASLYGYFSRDDVTACSHFYVAADGRCEQYVSTIYQSPANIDANADSISVETQDQGAQFPAWSGSDVPAWTPAQVEALAGIARWLRATHGIPLIALPDSKAGRWGVGSHRLGIEPWRVDGGETWSTANGKVCPGDRRVAQVDDVIILAALGEAPRMLIFKTPDGRYWITNGVTKRYISDPNQLNAFRSAGVVDAGAWTQPVGDGIPTDTQVQITSAVTDVLDNQHDTIYAKLQEIGAGNVDYNLLATKVADLLAARLAS